MSSCPVSIGPLSEASIHLATISYSRKTLFHHVGRNLVYMILLLPLRPQVVNKHKGFGDDMLQ